MGKLRMQKLFKANLFILAVPFLALLFFSVNSLTVKAQTCGACFPFGPGDPCAEWAPGSSCDGCNCTTNEATPCWQLEGMSSPCPGAENVCAGRSFYNICGTCYGTKSCAPLNISGSCDASGNISLNWSGGIASPYYYLRIDETSNNGQPGEIDGWYLSNPPDLIYNGLYATSYSYAGIPGKTYDAWVHPYDVSTTVHTSFSCPASSCNLPWGGSIASGASVTAYVAPSVACGSVCASETRTCNNGSLSGSYGNSACSVAVCPAPTLSFSASPTSIPYGGSSTLTWSTTDATSCWADWSGWVAVNGSVSTGALTANLAYNLTCYNSASVSTGTKSVTVSVSDLPTATATVSPNPVPYGGTPSFTLASTNGYYCYLLIDSATYLVNGYVTTGTFTNGAYITPGNHIAQAYCYNSAWAGSGLSTTNFTVSPTPIPTLTFNNPVPILVPAGGTTTLSWSTAGVTSCTASGGWSGNPAVNGSSLQTINATTTFSLQCQNATGVLTTKQDKTVGICTQATCIDQICGSGICGKKLKKDCVDTCDGCTPVETASCNSQNATVSCPACNSGTWHEIAP